MKCPLKTRDGESVLLDYAAGHIEHSSRRLLRSHLLECEACSQLVKAQSRLWTNLDDWEVTPVGFDFDSKLYASMERSPRLSPWCVLSGAVQRLSWRPAVSLALTTLLVLAGFLWDRTGRTSSTDVPNTAPAIIPADVERLDKALDDVQLLHELDVVKDEAPAASHHM